MVFLYFLSHYAPFRRPSSGINVLIVFFQLFYFTIFHTAPCTVIPAAMNVFPVGADSDKMFFLDFNLFRVMPVFRLFMVFIFPSFVNFYSAHTAAGTPPSTAQNSTFAFHCLVSPSCSSLNNSHNSLHQFSCVPFFRSTISNTTISGCSFL